MVLRKLSTDSWEEDSAESWFASETVDVDHSWGRTSRVKFSKGLQKIDFLPVFAGKERRFLENIISRPHFAGRFEVSKRLGLAIATFFVMMFGPAIRDFVRPILAPIVDRVPDVDLHGRRDLVRVIIEFLQIDHLLHFVGSLFNPVGAVLVPLAGLAFAYFVGWKGAKNTQLYWAKMVSS